MFNIRDVLAMSAEVKTTRAMRSYSVSPGLINKRFQGAPKEKNQGTKVRGPRRPSNMSSASNLSPEICSIKVVMHHNRKIYTIIHKPHVLAHRWPICLAANLEGRNVLKHGNVRYSGVRTEGTVLIIPENHFSNVNTYIVFYFRRDNNLTTLSVKLNNLATSIFVIFTD